MPAAAARTGALHTWMPSLSLHCTPPTAQLTVAVVMAWLRDNLLTERPELFMKGDSVCASEGAGSRGWLAVLLQAAESDVHCVPRAWQPAGLVADATASVHPPNMPHPPCPAHPQAARRAGACERHRLGAVVRSLCGVSRRWA